MPSKEVILSIRAWNWLLKLFFAAILANRTYIRISILTKVASRTKVVAILVIRASQVSREVSCLIVLADNFIPTELWRVEEAIVRN